MTIIAPNSKIQERDSLRFATIAVYAKRSEEVRYRDPDGDEYRSLSNVAARDASTLSSS
jgi:hypothetical protein